MTKSCKSDRHLHSELRNRAFTSIRHPKAKAETRLCGISLCVGPSTAGFNPRGCHVTPIWRVRSLYTLLHSKPVKTVLVMDTAMNPPPIMQHSRVADSNSSFGEKSSDCMRKYRYDPMSSVTIAKEKTRAPSG